ncbi:MAG: hypothetical protein KQH83_12190, partial [Actinobacteria bacterium]|nr:hypothetical protein [Actinomycetota bacterium]
MSRSDEEGFHPHPGDPWHPGWDEDGGEDPFASAPEDDASDEEKPRRRRGLFGRRKSRAEEPSAGVPEEFVDDGGLPEPGGWETLDDEMVVADLESIAPESAPSWTDEGGSSVEFESAFTVGGDLSTGEEEAVDPDADADADALDADALAADALPTPEEPTEILDAVALPDLPELAGAGPDDEGISADAGSDDLARAVQEAAAVLGARNGDEAVGIAEDELDAVEVDDLPGAVDDGPAGAGPSDDGVQETLLAAGLDLEETGPPADPGYTPEADDEDGDTPWEAPSAPAPDGEDDDDIVAVEDVDAALAAIASEPVAAADQDALDALRALGDDDEDDQWAAFAEGAPLAPSAASGDLTEPPPPAVPGGDEWLGDEDPEEQAAGDRAAEDQGGFFARRRARRAAGQEDVPPEQDAAWDEAPAAGWGAADEPETGLDADPDAAGAPDDEGPSGWDAAGGPDAGAAAPEAAGDTAAGDEAWDDALATDDEADAFFAGGGDEQDGGFFARRRARKAAEAAAADAVPVDGWGAEGEPAAAWGEEPAEPDPAWAPGAVEDAASGHEEPSAGPGSEAPPTAAGPGYGADAADAGVEEPPAGRDRDQDDWDQGDLEQAEAGDALREPGSPVDEQPWEQPVADLPLLDDGDDRIEVMPLGEQPQPPEPVEPIAAPPPAPPVPAAESEVEDEYGEWRGEGGRVPSSWFADIDEDEVDVEDIRPADVEEPAPMLEAGGMFDVDDILDPIDEPVEQAPGSFEASAPRAPETAPGPAAGEPEVVSEPPDVFVPAPGGG